MCSTQIVHLLKRLAEELVELFAAPFDAVFNLRGVELKRAEVDLGLHFFRDVRVCDRLVR